MQTPNSALAGLQTSLESTFWQRSRGLTARWLLTVLQDLQSRARQQSLAKPAAHQKALPHNTHAPSYGPPLAPLQQRAHHVHWAVSGAPGPAAGACRHVGQKMPPRAALKAGCAPHSAPSHPAGQDLHATIPAERDRLGAGSCSWAACTSMVAKLLLMHPAHPMGHDLQAMTWKRLIWAQVHLAAPK